MKFANIPFKNKSLYRLMKFMKPRWLLYVLTLAISSSIEFGMGLTCSYGMKWVADSVVGNNYSLLLKSVIFMAIGFGSFALIIPFIDYILNYTVEKTTGDIRTQLFHHVQRLPVFYFEQQHSGDIISRLTNDVLKAKEAYRSGISDFLTCLISGVGSGIIIFANDWRLGSIIIAVGLFNIFINSFYIQPLRSAGKEVQENLSSCTQKISDILAGTHVIRSFNLQKLVNSSYLASNMQVRDAAMKRTVQNTKLSGLNVFISFLNYSFIIIAGSFLIINHKLGFGTFVLILNMSGSLFMVFRYIGSTLTSIQGSLAAADRIFEIMDMPSEDAAAGLEGAVSTEAEHFEINMSDKPLSCKSDKPAPVVELKSLSFYYNPENSVLDNVSLEVSKNQVAAIVGSSGGGKSTLFKLLMNFYQPNSGEIRILGKPISSYRLEELRKLIAYVPQDNYLFSGTIMENIAFGKEGAAGEEVIEAAKAAFAHDFIMKLPEGYNSQVGERGTYLSGGERQRVAIARALLKNAPVLLLDEATASLDSESEKQVQSALEVLMEGRTTLVVAHRLTTIERADRIFVLEDGAVCEKGNHKSLMDLGGRYAYLYNLQFQL